VKAAKGHEIRWPVNALVPAAGERKKQRNQEPSAAPAGWCGNGNKEDPMAGIENIKEHMEVIGSDGKHVGTVDHMDSGNRIKLTKTDPKAGGKHHFISADWIDHVDNHVHLNKSADDAFKMWEAA
jgi:hypothetical protein